MSRKPTRRAVVRSSGTVVTGLSLAGLGSAQTVCPSVQIKVEVFATDSDAQYLLTLDGQVECQEATSDVESTDRLFEEDGRVVIAGTEPAGGTDTYITTDTPRVDTSQTQNVRIEVNGDVVYRD